MATKKQPKKSIEITASYGGKFNTGNYEQESDMYCVKKIIEGIELTVDEIKSECLTLRNICNEMVMEDKLRLNKEPLITDDIQTVVVSHPMKGVQTRMAYIACMSQCTTVEELLKIGKEISNKKDKFTKESLDEMRKEYDEKMSKLKGTNDGLCGQPAAVDGQTA